MTEVNWEVSVSGSPHGIIVGIPGQGKSVATRQIIKQMHQKEVSTLVFDFHGDMADAADNYSEVIDVGKNGLPFSPFEVRGNIANSAKTAALEIADIFTVVGKLGEIQRANVFRALQAAYSAAGWNRDVGGDRLPTISEFVVALQGVEANNKGANAGTRLMDITEFDLFHDENLLPSNFLKPGGTIVRVDGMGSEAVKLAAGAFLMRKIYNDMFGWGQTSAIRLFVILDEAHLLAGDVTIPKLMKEGRKFGVALLLVSQSLDDFRNEVLENAGAKIAFRTNFPASKKVAQFLAGSNSSHLAGELEHLQVGEALVATSQLNVPVKTRITIQ